MRRIVLLVLAVGLVAGCSTGHRDLELGIKRVALALAFADEDKAQPVPPKVVYQLIPAPPALVDEAPPTPPASLPPFELPAFITCPKANLAGAPEQAVLRLASAPPEAGAYPRRNTGTVHVEGGLVPLDLPYPPFSLWEYGAATHVDVPADPTGAVTPAETDDEFTVKKALTPDFFTVETLRRTSTGIVLVKRETSANGAKTTFTPSPPPTVYQFGVENDEWRSAAVDTDTSTAILITGKILEREVVDVCGTLVDTYRAQYTEELVNLDTGEVSGTDPSATSLINVAPQLGALVVKEDMHLVSHVRDAKSGAPLTISMTYVSTASSTEPVPPGLL
jgi:hypothetical protein